MPRYRNTTYNEAQPASPNERWGAGMSSFTREFILQDGSFQGRMQTAYDLIGYQVVVPTGGVALSTPGVANTISAGYIHRVTPMPATTLASFLVAPPVQNDIPAQPGGATLIPDMTERFWAMGITKTQPLGPSTGQSKVIRVDSRGLLGSDYPKARITVEFAPAPYQVLDDAAMFEIGAVSTNFSDGNPHPDEGKALATFGWQNTRYISRHLEPFSRLIKIPYAMVWNIGYPPRVIDGLPKQTKIAVATREGGCTAIYTWHRVPLSTDLLLESGLVATSSGANFLRIQNALSTINNATFDIFPTGTLLFDHFSSREYQGAFGEWLADISFTFISLPHRSTGANWPSGPHAGYPMGWNSLYDIVNGKADYYQISPQQFPAAVGLPYQNVFDYSDFSSLFRP